MKSQTRQLHHAAHSGDTATLKRLLESGLDPDLRSSDGWNAFHQAAAAGKTDCVALLLDADADMEAVVTEEGISGTKGLALAIMNGWVDTVDFLIRRGVDVNRVGAGRRGALALANTLLSRPWHKIGRQTEAIIKLLQEAGAHE